MLLFSRIIAILLSLAVVSGSAGIPLFEAYCCDIPESVSAYVHRCDDCGTPDNCDENSGGNDCCTTKVEIKKVENSGWLPTKEQHTAVLDITPVFEIISADIAAFIPEILPLSALPIRGAPPSVRQTLALVCNLRL
ncbi:hypothetical protein MASR2M18_18550 [Ignavibacteria bacterium]|nr:hypothetical protein [Bacteroidota bacterium]MCZ2131881.1 hypothetical protein [Bacteroidota bacterium]